MRSMIDMDTVQIELTDACRNSCSNCTRFCGHRPRPFFMEMDFFKRAIDSMEGYPKMVGFQGGEPLLHPNFEEMCNYARSKFPKEQLGLWTTLPSGLEKHRDVICKTFHHIFINDHSRSDVFHHPGLVAIEEVMPNDKGMMWYHIDHCWAQMSWSASVNPKGAFFCEIAAAMSLLFNEEGGWPVEPGWWYRIPKDFKEQVDRYCPRCGFAAPLGRRASTEGIDDISPKNLDRIKYTSPKIARGKYKVHNLRVNVNPEPMASYKDFDYRNRIASKYGMFLCINEQNTWTPYLTTKEYKESIVPFDRIKERHK